MHGRYGTTTGQHIMNEHLRRLAIYAASVIAAIAGTPAVASTAVNEKVNFQPSLSTVPAGYTADSGAAYSEATGRGWVHEDSLDAADHVPLDVSPNTRERNAVTDQRH